MNSPTPQPIDREQLIKLRTMYYQAKTCNVLAVVFAVCGFLVFARIYESRIAPDFMAALHDVSTLGLIVAAFLPAFFLSMLARKYEKRYMALLKTD